jgi:hypothetical protein
MPFTTKGLRKILSPSATQKRTQNEPKRSQSQKSQKRTHSSLFKRLTTKFATFTAEKTKPKRTQFLKSHKMNVSLIFTKDYENLPLTETKKRTQTNPMEVCKFDYLQGWLQS